MPSEPPPGPGPAPPGIGGHAGQTPPVIGGPPTRTSPRTLLLSGIGVAAVLVVWAVQMGLVSVTSSAAGSGDPGGAFPAGLFLVVVLVGALLTAVQWWARTYVVGVDELVIDEGVLARRRRVVPYGRVQQIDIDQRFLAQILSLGTLTIETAGSSGGTVRLGMLDIASARGLRSHILARRSEIDRAAHADASGPPGHGPAPPPGAVGPTGTPAAPERVLVRLGAGRLAVAGLTHHSVVVAAPVLVLAGLVVGAFSAPAVSGVAPLVVVGAAVGVASAVTVGVAVLGLVGSVVDRHGYTLVEAGDDLHLRFGLLQVRHVTMPRRRVQHVTVTDNPLRRLLGLVEVRLHSAAPVVDAGSSPSLVRNLGAVGGQGADLQIPVLDRRDLDAVLEALMGPGWSVPEWTPRPPAARRRAVTRRVGILAVVLIGPAMMFPPGSLVLLGAASIGVPWGLVAHRRAGFATGDHVVALARGVVHHRIDLLPFDRIQSTFTRSSPWQRLAGLETLHVNVAGRAGDPSLFDLGRGTAAVQRAELPRRSAPGVSTGVPPGSGWGLRRGGRRIPGHAGSHHP